MCIGQTSAQRPQRMQEGFSTVLSSSPQKASRALVPLVVPTERSYMALPIMGPPMRIFLGSDTKPPAFSKT